MKIDAIRMRSYNLTPVVTFATFNLNDPSPDDPYILSDATGLDAEEIVPQFYGTYGNNFLFDMRLKPRQISLRIKINPDYDNGEHPSTLRDELYKAIANSRAGLILLEFMDGADVAGYITGSVRKFETSIFSNDPEVAITLMCDNPMIMTDYVAADLREGDATNTLTQEIGWYDNVSTAPHGFHMRFSIEEATVDPLVLTAIDTLGGSGETFTLDDEFVQDQEIYISTEYNNRYVNIETPHTFIADKIASGSIWPIMFPGLYILRFNCDVKVSLLSYRHEFWGV
jgi:hypothetical protein